MGVDKVSLDMTPKAQAARQNQARGSQPSPWVGPGKPTLPLWLRGKAGGGARVTAGPKRPHLSVCLGLPLLTVHVPSLPTQLML